MNHPPAFPALPHLTAPTERMLRLVSESETAVEYRGGPNDRCWLRGMAEPNPFEGGRLTWRYQAGWDAEGDDAGWQSFAFCRRGAQAVNYLNGAWLDREKAKRESVAPSP